MSDDLPDMIFDLDLEALQQIPNPWGRLVGYVATRFEPGEVLEGHVDIEARHHQPYGLVHGGVWSSIVEGAASMAAGLTARANVVGVSNQTDFLRSHRTGRVDVVTTPLHVGRTAHVWEIRITRADDGKLVARGQVRLQVLDEVR